MSGSMRRRGDGTYELRVYRVVDPGTGRQRWATRTVHGSKRHATRELAALVEEVACARLHVGTVAELLNRWFETASPGWSATTFVENRSVVRHHLVPNLGHIRVADLTQPRSTPSTPSSSATGGRTADLSRRARSDGCTACSIVR